MRFTIQGYGFRVHGIGLRAKGLSLWIEDLGVSQGFTATIQLASSGFRLHDLWLFTVKGLQIWGSGFRVESLGSTPCGLS
jgi:hypothetical protein